MSGQGVPVHEERILDNGLRVVCVPRPAASRAVVTWLLRVGPRYESTKTNGISHFLEHMMYRGCRSCPSAHDQALAFERLGGTLEAATHSDYGVMSLTLPPESLGPALELFAEVIAEPRFSDIETERGIVREEILEDLDDEGRQIDADNLARALMYGSHPLGFTITGSLDQLERFDRAMLREHHARHYTARNGLLSFAGAIDPDRCFRDAGRHFGAMPPGALVPCERAPSGQKRPRFQYVHNLSSQTTLRVAFRAPGDHDPLEPATELLLRVLDDGMSTRLYDRICDSKGLCYDVSALFETYEDDGVFDVAAEAQHDRAGTVAREVFSILADLAGSGPTEDELAKAKARMRWHMRAMADDSDALAGFYGLAWLAGTVRTPLARVEQIESITGEQVRAAAEHVFRPERLSVVAVGSLSSAQQKALEHEVRAFGRA